MTQVLLDTQVLLWWLSDDARLGPTSRASIADGDTRVLVSAASAWEIAIKRAIGKLDVPPDLELESVLREEGFQALAIEIRHAERAGDLPALHRDPFDRMLVAQAGIEKLTLMTADADVRGYDVRTVDASA